MTVDKLVPGLWRWTARHPDWTPDRGGPDGWEAEVASCYCEADGTILLVDPLVPAVESEREPFWRALDRDVDRLGAPHVVLTCAWHARSTDAVLARYSGARRWGAADPSLPGGAAGVPGLVDGDVLVWLPSHAALVSGDTLLGGGPEGVRPCPGAWHGDTAPAGARAALWRRLEHLPVERILPSHGGPPVLADARARLARALS